MAAARFAFPLLLLGSAFMSAGPLLVRLADVGAVQSAFWRVALAVAPLFLIARWVARGRPVSTNGTSLRWFALAALFFAADLAAWHLGIKRTTLANAALFSNLASFMYPLVGFAIARSLPGGRQVAAMLLAAAGATLLLGLSAEVSARNLTGDLLCLLTAVFYTGYLLVMERTRDRTSAFDALAPMTAFAALFLLPMALLTDGTFWPSDWTPLVALAIGSQVIGQGLLIFALPHVPAVAAGLALLIQPLLSAAYGFIWFGERMSPLEALGMAAILAALVLIRLPGRATP